MSDVLSKTVILITTVENMHSNMHSSNQTTKMHNLKEI